jgi:ABC-type dipeptide/oligopeptide/nickel transport system permease component
VLLSLLMRRLLWVPPTLFIVSAATFLVLSFVPPAERPGAIVAPWQAGASEVDALPRFFNPAPRDVRARSLAALEAVAEGGADAGPAMEELVRLGGAALPHVVPKLDGYPPETRARIATGLAPLAERMGLEDAERARDPRTAASFWSRTWDARSVEFRPATAKTMVDRLARYRTEARARELAKLDTYALPALLARLEPPEHASELDVTRTLVEAISRVTGLDERIEEDATLDEARSVVSRCRAYGRTHEAHFRHFEGGTRVVAMFTETRYGKWVSAAVDALLVEAPEAEAQRRRIRLAAPVTLTLLFGGIALAHVLGLLLGTASAVARGTHVDYGISAVVLTLYALPTAALAAWLHRLVGLGSLWLPVVLVAAGLVAAPTRHQRASLAYLIAGDVVRAARARGASRLRATLGHGVRPASASVLSLVAIEPPMALSAVFVVEHVFGLDGLGALTLHAVVERDVSYLMGLSIGAATLAVLVVLASDLAQGLLDPRLRAELSRTR